VLLTFRESLGGFAGEEISDESLGRAVETCNENRSRVREMYELRKSAPPLISGAEVNEVLVAAGSVPVEESISMLAGVTSEAKQRTVSGRAGLPRLMVVGAQVDDASFIRLVEDTGADVVADDLCPGAREYRAQVKVTDDPIDGIAERYLRGIHCGRTYFEQTGSYPEYLEQRFGHIGRYIRDFQVDGVILYIYKYCDPFGFEVPAMKSYIESLGTPVLYLEDEYSMSTMARLRTRVQAFLEIIGQR
jgi:benzoyl-CoA reductase/2-hydroxyglutaryl-CoA dehydratase subunit BcrC/BadD/HgdB